MNRLALTEEVGVLPARRLRRLEELQRAGRRRRREADAQLHFVARLQRRRQRDRQRRAERLRAGRFGLEHGFRPSCLCVVMQLL